MAQITLTQALSLFVELSQSPAIIFTAHALSASMVVEILPHVSTCFLLFTCFILFIDIGRTSATVKLLTLKHYDVQFKSNWHEWTNTCRKDLIRRQLATTAATRSFAFLVDCILITFSFSFSGLTKKDAVVVLILWLNVGNVKIVDLDQIQILLLFSSIILDYKMISKESINTLLMVNRWKNYGKLTLLQHTHGYYGTIIQQKWKMSAVFILSSPGEFWDYTVFGVHKPSSGHQQPQEKYWHCEEI